MVTHLARSRRPRLAVRSPAVIVAILAAALPARGEPPQPNLAGTFDAFLKKAVEKAFTEAVARAGRDRCRQIFSEFHDGAGRSLDSSLGAQNTTGQDYLGRLRFANGEAAGTCREPSILAFTHPGSRTIYLCGRRFGRIAFADIDLAAALILHEALHSLGLGENPPSSREITARVIERCGHDGVSDARRPNAWHP